MTSRPRNLIIGAAPIRPPIPGIDRENHFLVRNVPDVEQIAAWAEKSGQGRVVVVGGGYIGLEMAEQLWPRRLTVSLVEALPQVMASLDPEMAACLHGFAGSGGDAAFERRGGRLCSSHGVIVEAA